MDLVLGPTHDVAELSTVLLSSGERIDLDVGGRSHLWVYSPVLKVIDRGLWYEPDGGR